MILLFGGMADAPLAYVCLRLLAKGVDFLVLDGRLYRQRFHEGVSPQSRAHIGIAMQASMYCIHGVGVRFTTDSAVMAAAAQTLLRYFRQATSAGPGALQLLLRGVHERAEIPIAVSPAARVLCSQQGKAAGDLLRSVWQCTLYCDHGRTVADFHDQGLLLIDEQQRRVEGYLIEPDAMHPDVRLSFLRFALTELLKRVGLYTIHATALERGGRRVLMAGFSGRGKTTSCLALLRAGYRCLSDDHPLVSDKGSGLEVLSFPVKIDVTEKTIELRGVRSERWRDGPACPPWPAPAEAKL